MAAIVYKYTNKEAIKYLKDLLKEIEENKIEVHSADRRVSSNSLHSLPA